MTLPSVVFLKCHLPTKIGLLLQMPPVTKQRVSGIFSARVSQWNKALGSLCAAVPVLLLSDTAGPPGSKGKSWMCKYKSKRDVMSSFFLFGWNNKKTQQKKNELGCSLSAVTYLCTNAVKQIYFFIQVSQDGKALLDVLQRPLSPGNSESLTATANYSKAVHQVLDVVHEVLHHQRRLESIWQHRKVRLHQRLQLCVFQQDVQQVISLLKR